MIDGALILMGLAVVGGPIAVKLQRRWAEMKAPKEETDAADKLERSLWALAKSSGASFPELRDGTYAIDRLELPEARVRLEASLLDHRGTVEVRVSGPMTTGTLTFYADQLHLGPHGRALVGDGEVATVIGLGAFLIRFAPRVNSLLFKVVRTLASRNQSIALIGMSRGMLQISARLNVSSWSDARDIHRVARLLARVYDAFSTDWAIGRPALLARFSAQQVSASWSAWTLAAAREGSPPQEEARARRELSTSVDAEVAALAMTAEDLELEGDHLETDRLYALLLAAHGLAPLEHAPPRRTLVEGSMRRVIGALDLELIDALADELYPRLSPQDVATLAASVPRTAPRFVSRWLAEVHDAVELDALIGACVAGMDVARLPPLFDQLLQRATSWPQTLRGLSRTRLDAASARALAAPLISTAQTGGGRLHEDALFVAVSALYYSEGVVAEAIGELLSNHVHTPAPIGRLRALASGSPGVTADGARAAKAALARITGAAVASGRAGGLELSSGRGGELSPAQAQAHRAGGLSPADP